LILGILRAVFRNLWRRSCSTSSTIAFRSFWTFCP